MKIISYLWGRRKKDTRVSGVVVIGMSSDDGMCVEPIVTQATRSVCKFSSVRYIQEEFKPTGSLFQATK